MAERLAEVLAAENEALAAVDLPRAAAILPQKQWAITEFAAHPAALAQADHAAAAALLERLAALAGENRRLLDRGIKAQGELIGMLAKLVRQSPHAPRYGARGALRGQDGPLSMTLRAQA